MIGSGPNLFDRSEKRGLPESCQEEGQRSVPKVALLTRVDVHLGRGRCEALQDRFCRVVGDLLEHRLILRLVGELDGTYFQVGRSSDSRLEVDGETNRPDALTRSEPARSDVVRVGLEELARFQARHLPRCAEYAVDVAAAFPGSIAIHFVANRDESKRAEVVAEQQFDHVIRQS